MNKEKTMVWDRKHVAKGGGDRHSRVSPFLKYCHEKFDKEVTFTGVQEALSRQPAKHIHNTKNYTRFARVRPKSASGL